MLKKYVKPIGNYTTTIYHGDFTVYLTYNEETFISKTVRTLKDGKSIEQTYLEPTLSIMDAIRTFQTYLKTIDGAL
jgi:hypothetical protein